VVIARNKGSPVNLVSLLKRLVPNYTLWALHGSLPVLSYPVKPHAAVNLKQWKLHLLINLSFRLPIVWALMKEAAAGRKKVFIFYLIR